MDSVVPPVLYQNISRLDISMDDLLIVEIRDTIKPLNGDLSSLSGRCIRVAVHGEIALWDVFEVELWAIIEDGVLQSNNIVLERETDQHR